MKFKNKLMIGIAISFLLTSCSSTTKKYYAEITGKILDNNIPVNNAEVLLTLEASNKRLKFISETDSNGNFRFHEISKLKFIGGKVVHSGGSYSITNSADIEEVSIIVTVNSKKYIGIIGKRAFILNYGKYNVLSIICDINKKSTNTENNSISNKNICITHMSRSSVNRHK